MTVKVARDDYWSTGRRHIKPVDGDYGIEPAQAAKVFKTSYFWGSGAGAVKDPSKLRDYPWTGYKQARELIEDHLNPECWKKVQNVALSKIERVFSQVASGADSGEDMAVIRLSDQLEAWKDSKFKEGKVVPAKGYGLNRASDAVIDIMGVGDLPEPLLTNAALWGSGFANFLLGAHDARVLYSNYWTDMGFYFEHGYHKAFPEYEGMLKHASQDSHALSTFGGKDRRDMADLGLNYTRSKARLETANVSNLANKTAKLKRKEAIAINFCECSIWGMAAEMLAEGADKGGVINDFAFSSPGTDLIDVGADINNSEIFNSFLNTADVTESGVVTEEILRRIYDAYGYSCARMFTERWSDPGTRMCSTLFTWHVQNSRHRFLRRSVLGYDKIRPNAVPNQREADFDEVFDENFHTTGFSRPLKNACNGEDVCDHVQNLINEHHGNPLLKDLWYYLSQGPVEYSAGQVIDEEREDELAEGLRIAMARGYAYGLVDETAWLMAHSNQHAWHINYLFEAGMFGSLLDDGSLKGKLDRYDG